MVSFRNAYFFSLIKVVLFAYKKWAKVILFFNVKKYVLYKMYSIIKLFSFHTNLDILFVKYSRVDGLEIFYLFLNFSRKLIRTNLLI